MIQEIFESHTTFCIRYYLKRKEILFIPFGRYVPSIDEKIEIETKAYRVVKKSYSVSKEFRIDENSIRREELEITLRIVK